MRLHVVILLSSIFLFSYAQQGDLLPAKQGTLWGYINPEGEWVIKPQFERCHPFHNRDYTSAVRNGKIVVITRQGLVEENLDVDEIVSIEDDVVLYRTAESYGIYNKATKFNSGPKYLQVSMSDVDGLIQTKTVEGVGITDATTGNRVVPHRYERVHYRYDHWICYRGKKIGVHQLTGKHIVPDTLLQLNHQMGIFLWPYHQGQHLDCRHDWASNRSSATQRFRTGSSPLHPVSLQTQNLSFVPDNRKGGRLHCA